MDNRDHDQPDWARARVAASSSSDGPRTMRSGELAELRKTLVIPEPLIPPPPPIPGGGPPSSVGRRPTLPSVSPLPMMPISDSHAPLSVSVYEEDPIELPVDRARWPKMLTAVLALGALAFVGWRIAPRPHAPTAVASLAPRIELAVAHAVPSPNPAPEASAQAAQPEADDVTPPRAPSRAPRSGPSAPAPPASTATADAADEDPTGGDLVNPYQTGAEAS